MTDEEVEQAIMGCSIIEIPYPPGPGANLRAFRIEINSEHLNTPLLFPHPGREHYKLVAVTLLQALALHFKNIDE